MGYSGASAGTLSCVDLAVSAMISYVAGGFAVEGNSETIAERSISCGAVVRSLGPPFAYQPGKYGTIHQNIKGPRVYTLGQK